MFDSDTLTVLSLCSHAATVASKAMDLKRTMEMLGQGGVDIFPARSPEELTVILNDRMSEVTSDLRRLKELLNTIEL